MQAPEVFLGVLPSGAWVYSTMPPSKRLQLYRAGFVGGLTILCAFFSVCEFLGPNYCICSSAGLPAVEHLIRFLVWNVVLMVTGPIQD